MLYLWIALLARTIWALQLPDARLRAGLLRRVIGPYRYTMYARDSHSACRATLRQFVSFNVNHIRCQGPRTLATLDRVIHSYDADFLNPSSTTKRLNLESVEAKFKCRVLADWGRCDQAFLATHLTGYFYMKCPHHPKLYMRLAGFAPDNIAHCMSVPRGPRLASSRSEQRTDPVVTPERNAEVFVTDRIACLDLASTSSNNR